ncbi:DUF397 domain-containing protein [Streptomyces xylophagus]|uniref:DUF397 domain-containing protein n=1 Tax=Streptomyces xylophagus TaxID=285514 RepID=UPI0005B7A0A7|nr:DUF397 domain-containing protein [Streptomyces xylophagus]
MSTSDLAWFKSSYSSSGDGDCVEIATSPSTIHIRDSKNNQNPHNPQSPQLALSPATWTEFIRTV